MALLLDRYTLPLPIRARGAFHLLSARRASDGRSCVLVLPGPSADPALIAAALDEVERAHALVEHPLVPRVAARGSSGDTPFLEFDCAAVTDGIEVVRMLADAEEKVPYGAADAFIARLRTALQAAHAGGLCMGRISVGNILFDAAGRSWLVGFGRNFPVEKDDGTLDGTVPFFQAPELSTGAAPSPMGDYVALLLLMRSMLPYVDLSGSIGRVLRGDIRPSDVELIDCLRWVDQRVLGELPALRASMTEAIAVADRIRAHLGAVLDPDGFAAYVAALIERDGGREVGREPGEAARAAEANAAQGGASVTLTLGCDAAWITAPDGTRQRLGRAQRRILLALVERHRTGAESPLTMPHLLEIGWPGETPVFEAGANRVYVALARLRQMGLRDVIERFDDGYRLAPQTVVRRAE